MNENWFEQARASLKDKNNRGLIKILKWIAVLASAVFIPGLAGLITAIVIICAWKIPKA